jgi:hypothetical protein
MRALSIARRRAVDFSSAGGGEAEEQMWFGPIGLSDRHIYGMLGFWAATWIYFSG